MPALGQQTYRVWAFGRAFGARKRGTRRAIHSFGRDSMHETVLGGHLAPAVALRVQQRDSALDEVKDARTLEQARR
ncbi:MAG TPA: hypothetical protein VH161_09250, partial [Candidatus Acidoferrales bacterium]|nr:hypothetical protein [Candidatus Acidoferrales bacterium]